MKILVYKTYLYSYKYLCRDACIYIYIYTHIGYFFGFLICCIDWQLSQIKGFDDEAIKANTKPHNIKVCPVLGPTYRVPILDAGISGVKGKGREDDNQNDKKKPRFNEEESSSESSSSSSSSRRKSKKDKKKSKKDKKSKKEKKKEKRRKEEEKKTKADTHLAEKKSRDALKCSRDFAPKVNTMVDAYERIVGSPMFAQTPQPSVDIFKGWLKNLKEMSEDMAAILAGETRSVRNAPDAKSARTFLGDAKRRLDAYNQMLTMAGRL